MERWFLTARERTAITSATKELCGICNSDSKRAHKEAGLITDEENVKKLIKTVLSVMSNPFDMEIVDDGVTVPLSNLPTGVVKPQDIATRLLNAEKLGMQEMNSFIMKRITSNETGFWDTLPKMKIKTFANMVKKVQAKPSEKKLATVNSDRNLFVHLLIASKSRAINLRDLLKYELSPVPWALAHTDGSQRKNTKSCLLSLLEECVQDLPRLLSINSDELSDAYVLDGMAAVQMLKTAGAQTFGEMSSSYFDGITAPLGKNNCVRVDVVFDRYDKADSIKEGERVRGGAIAGFEVKIPGPNTVRNNWKSFISNPVNKINLQHFLNTIRLQKGTFSPCTLLQQEQEQLQMM